MHNTGAQEALAVGRRYRLTLAVEALVGTIISIVIGGVMFAIMFAGQSVIPVWGKAGLVFDAVPSTFIPVVLMGVGIPLVVRRRRDLGHFDEIAAVEVPAWLRALPTTLYVRALLLAMPAAGAMVVLSAVVATISAVSSVSFGAAFALKVAQNIAIGTIFAPLIVARALAEPSRSNPTADSEASDGAATAPSRPRTCR